MKSIDTTLLRQLMSKNEQIIQEGRAAELREQDGYTNESLIEAAKKLLKISNDDLIAASFEEVTKKQNLEVNSLISIANTLKTSGDSFSPEVKKAFEDGMNELLEKVAANYNVDKDDLFEEE